MDSSETKRLPPWFRVRLETTKQSNAVRNILGSKNLHTVCKSAACPNRTECWNQGTATFLILGDVCTRGCRFCNVPKGRPAPPEMDEPARVAEAVRSLNLNYAVVTSVTRDDLADGGAGIFAATLRAIRSASPHCRIEVLIPDFQGSKSALETVLAAGPDVLNHNLETVPSLYSRVRPQADYQRSLELLGRARSLGALTKTGLMLGLGEGKDEVIATMHDIREKDCAILTLGQYLRPGKTHLPVAKFYHPDEFAEFRSQALALGFRHVVSGPLVRSSYHAGREHEQAARDSSCGTPLL